MPVPCGYLVPDGRDLSDIFMAGSSSHVTNYIGMDGLDIGDSFQGGHGSVTTGFKTTNGVDVGRLFRSFEDQSRVLVWMHLHNDDETYFNLDFVNGTNTCYHVGNHGWPAYRVYEEQIHQDNIAISLTKMRTYGAKPVFTIKNGYTADMTGGLKLEQFEQPSAANGWCFKYNVEEDRSGEHDFWFEVDVEFF